MRKTLEIYYTNADEYVVHSPDHEEEFSVTGFTLDIGDRESLMEAGRQTVDIEPDEYYHIEEDEDIEHVTITVEDYEQGPKEFGFPYYDEYMINEKVSKVDIPNTQQAKSCFQYMPDLVLHMEYNNGNSEAVAVTLDKTRYKLVEE